MRRANILPIPSTRSGQARFLKFRASFVFSKRVGNVLPIALIAFAIVAFVFMVDYSIGGGKWPWSVNNVKNTSSATTGNTNGINTNDGDFIVCPQDAKLCPDGSYVARSGPKCEFAACPGTNRNTSTDPTADWKTYTNTIWGFSFKYPSNWVIISDNIQTSDSGISSNALRLGVQNSQGKYMPNLWLFYDPLGFGTPGADLQYTLQRGSNGFQVTAEQSGQKMVPDTTTYVIQASEPDTQSKAFFMTFTQSAEEKSTWPQTVKQILSTFTFTLTYPTADWKTYTNTEVGYSVKYPSAWVFSSCPDIASAYFGTNTIRCATEGSGDFFSINALDTTFNFARSTNELKNSMIDPIETTISVGGQQATRITGTVRRDESFMTGGGEYKDDVYILHNNSYINIGYFILNGEKKLTTEFSNFLNSFTFTQ